MIPLSAPPLSSKVIENSGKSKVLSGQQSTLNINIPETPVNAFAVAGFNEQPWAHGH